MYIYIYMYICTHVTISKYHLYVEITTCNMLQALLSSIGCVPRRRNKNPEYLAGSLVLPCERTSSPASFVLFLCLC